MFTIRPTSSCSKISPCAAGFPPPKWCITWRPRATRFRPRSPWRSRPICETGGSGPGILCFSSVSASASRGPRVVLSGVEIRAVGGADRVGNRRSCNQSTALHRVLRAMLWNCSWSASGKNCWINVPSAYMRTSSNWRRFRPGHVAVGTDCQRDGLQPAGGRHL